MKIELQSGEQVLRETEANHYPGEYIIFGRLTLTNMQLVFSAHRINFKRYSICIPLADIVSIEYKNKARFFSHGLWVELKSGKRELFSIWNRRKWKSTIEQQLQQI